MIWLHLSSQMHSHWINKQTNTHKYVVHQTVRWLTYIRDLTIYNSSKYLVNNRVGEMFERQQVRSPGVFEVVLWPSSTPWQVDQRYFSLQVEI